MISILQFLVKIEVLQKFMWLKREAIKLAKSTGESLTDLWQNTFAIRVYDDWKQVLGSIAASVIRRFTEVVKRKLQMWKSNFFFYIKTLEVQIRFSGTFCLLKIINHRKTTYIQKLFNKNLLKFCTWLKFMKSNMMYKKYNYQNKVYVLGVLKTEKVKIFVFDPSMIMFLFK